MDNIIYNGKSVNNALKCLLNMRELENSPKFGELKDTYPKTNRYTLEYNNEVDSTFYTGKATALLTYTIDLYYADIRNDLDYEVDQFLLYHSFNSLSEYDLINNSQGEYANFNGDLSILESELFFSDKLCAYYSEFQILSEEEGEEIFKRLYLSETPSYKTAIKKTTTINGVDMDFYYLIGDIYDYTGDFFDLSRAICEHDLKVKYLEDRFSGSVLTAINNTRGCNDIIIASKGFSYAGTGQEAAAFADMTYGSIVVKDGYFEDSICHEMGHMFDRTDREDFFRHDYSLFNIGTWDLLAEKYADDIATIRKGADISCGYSADSMRDMHNEFYAESFQLYFYSPETRAALPEKVRNTLEKELSKYAGEQIGG